MLLVPNRPGKEHIMIIHDPLTTDAVLAAFDEHLRRTRGVCPEVRHTYVRFVRAFLEQVFEGGPVDPARICVRDIVEFVSAMTPRYRPPTVQLVATSLRSFFRFLRAEGLRDEAILLCVARLGLRASEVARLRLDDIDWRNGTVHIQTRKTGHGAILPLPGDLGAALATYLRHGRPATPARQVFVLH